MADPIEFYFDFSSPYGYLASRRSDEIEQATGRTVEFRPYLMGAVFKTTGRQPLVSHPLVWDYARNDIERGARRIGAPFTLPDPFPVVTASACRAFYRVETTDGHDAARALAHDLYAAYFVDGRDISSTEIVADIAAAGGRDRDRMLAALGDETLKARLRGVTDEAARRGVFGSPFFLVDGEAFWGNDRITDVIEWANCGGW